MGGVVAAVVAVVGAVVQSSQQKKAAKKAASARAREAAERKEAQKTQDAQQENVDRIERRKAIREERVRRAKIIQSSVNTGAAGSSGEIVSTGVLGTNTAAAISGQVGGRKAAQGVSGHLQAAADAGDQATNALAKGRLQVATTQAFSSVGQSIAGLDVFKK